ncbi:MAG: putative DNA binding domain-containing protein, partial [Candidatus Thermoplasmatota archaeon]|nr:putative DNA binding domain-containing protein [Candidatus Thermoplasmatota archaeon]
MQLNELLDIIKSGESERIEFKTKVTSEIGEEICAIANGFGGLLLIGIDDTGKVKGCNLETSKLKVSDHANSITPPVKINFDHLRIDDKDILILDIPQSTNLCSIGGIAYVRIGTSKRPLSMQEIFTIGAENLLYEIDKTPTDMKPDGSLVEEFHNSARTEIADIGSYLKRIGAITSDGCLSLAGLLIFYPDPEAIIPHAS